MSGLGKPKKGSIFYDELGRKCTILSIIIDGKKQIVFKYFGKYKKKWFYEIIAYDLLKEYLKLNLYTLKKRRFK